MSKKTNKKMLKVVYFDEGSAIDYLDIFNDGTVNKIKEKNTTINSIVDSEVEAKAKTGIFFKAIKPFADINLGGGLEASLSRLGESVVKATISNTVLSDFITVSEKDKSIEKTINYKISAFQDSITFMKMYTPYLNMMKLQDESINFQKIDETLEKSKGYYELIAINKSNKQVVLRFNIKAFRNNYNLVDLTRMDLSFYSVKVGKMDVNNLEAKKELNFKQQATLLTSDEIISGIDATDKIEADVFDVILAGIKSYG